MIRRFVASAAILIAVAAAGFARAEDIPPPPAAYFNDYASLVPSEDSERINTKLRAFDESTSNQVLVVVYPELPSASMEDFTVRAAQAWGAGNKKKDNGAILFMFVKDRKMRIETGYGLEGALPDAIAKRIVSDEIAPLMRAGEPGRALEAGVDAIIAATKGEYAADRGTPVGSLLPIILFILILLFFLWMARHSSASRTYNRDGYWTWGGGGFGGGSMGGGGWSSGGWGGGGGGGGGFSGGGGSFGGGGASGSW